MNLLDISRLENGRPVLKPAPVDFVELSGRLLCKFSTVPRLKTFAVSVKAWSSMAVPDLTLPGPASCWQKPSTTPQGGREGGCRPSLHRRQLEYAQGLGV
jgi:hypothetical protein